MHTDLAKKNKKRQKQQLEQQLQDEQQLLAQQEQEEQQLANEQHEIQEFIPSKKGNICILNNISLTLIIISLQTRKKGRRIKTPKRLALTKKKLTQLK